MVQKGKTNKAKAPYIMKRLRLLLIIVCLFLSFPTMFAETIAGRWSIEKVNKWYAQYPWLAGCDYIPANADNQIEMWSKATYDHATIDKELGWAEQLGFKTMRVFLSSLVYAHDTDGLKMRMDDFLSICASHDIKPMFVFFDDCWNAISAYGPQPQPLTGVHNSQWVQDPSCDLRLDTAILYPQLKRYVQDILTTFGKDRRILMWDLYNEPGNSSHGTTSLSLLRNVFIWARQCHPQQPLTAGIWRDTNDFKPLNDFQLSNSDIISYHDYHDSIRHEQEIKKLQALGRPLACTEYMARTRGSFFRTIMPLLKRHRVIAINWGLVTGKTNTRYAWDDPHPDGSEPDVWFHDILRPDGSPYIPQEVEFIKKLTH